MFREKLISTLVLASAVVGVTMLVDFIVTVVILHNSAAYTPFVTLVVSTIVAFPVTYGLMSGRINLRQARDALAIAYGEAQDARTTAQDALRAVEEARAKA